VLRALLAAALALAAPAAVAQHADPDWPCVQRKVPELWIGQMWPAEPPAAMPELDAAETALARRLSERRLPVEAVASEAAPLVEDLAPEARAERLAAVFDAVLARVNAERSAIIAGIARYARRQTALAERIEGMQLELAALEQAPEDARDWDRIELLRDTLEWDTRIFRDRSQSLTYVCETPVLLEQRAFAVARALAGLM
jgi:hypothetical protein